MNIPSFKKYVVTSFLVMPAMDELKGNRCAVLTNAGVIIGDPEPKKEADAFLENVVKEQAKAFRENHKIADDESFPGSDGCFTLYNATLFSNNQRFNFVSLEIFYDQIVGITIGPSDLMQQD